MALKGGRKIVVRERTFHWSLNDNGRLRFGGAPVRPHLAVQEDVEHSGRLIIHLESKRWQGWDAHDLDIGGTVHRATVSPKDVRAVIEAALDKGWDSSSRFVFPPEFDLTDYKTVEPPKPRPQASL